MLKTVLMVLWCCAIVEAQYGGLGGGWGIYGPYGRPPPGAYGPPRMPRPPPMRYGPQMEPCIYYGDCRGPRYPRPMPPPPRDDYYE